MDADEDFALDHDYNEEYEREHDSGSDPEGPRDHPRGRRNGGGKQARVRRVPRERPAG